MKQLSSVLFFQKRHNFFQGNQFITLFRWFWCFFRLLSKPFETVYCPNDAEQDQCHQDKVDDGGDKVADAKSHASRQIDDDLTEVCLEGNADDWVDDIGDQ